jgi:methionyl-tRNA formyltransferase
MNVVFLIGSGLRRAAISASRAAGFEVAALLTPASKRFDDLRELLTREHPGVPVRAVAKAEVGATLEQLDPDATLCIGWPYLFPAELVNTRQILNAHPTLLPTYRGPNAWGHIIANGEKEAGCTVHRLDEGMDSGPILHQRTLSLTPFDTYKSLRAQLLVLEPETIVEALDALRVGTATFTDQDESKASEYRDKRGPEDSILDASRPLSDLVNDIRACDPEGFPAFIIHNGQKVCIRMWRPEPPHDAHPESL